MALEALSTNELFNLIIYDTFSATPLCHNDASETTNLAAAPKPPQDFCGGDGGGLDACSSMPAWRRHSVGAETTPQSRQQNLAVQGGGRKKRRRRPKICKNKEEAETQRITHIAVERNRRKQMNEHLAVLRSLMPESYVQRGDQASIVGGAIEFVKELEHLLQSLEARKFQLLHGGGGGGVTAECGGSELRANPFSQFFSYPQYTCSPQLPNKYTSKSKAAIADIEVTLIETHANIRILLMRRVRHLSKIVAAFQTMYLSILHLNVATLHPLVLYSISAKVEEGCQLNSADEIAGAVHHMLRIIEEEDTLISTCQAV